ncbi:MAG TPA: menaquinone-dependent protoporphyrinogen IX dehydrogenase [Usitatibacteraceae bacterium]|nr:menaquinone-dependent protoporphyrinogen IX dehydrogenase [Usitatibacteraceae bacterium]
MTALIIYSTVDGQTLRICERLKVRFESAGWTVRLSTVAEAGGLDLAAFERIVIGASIRYGKHRADLVQFLVDRGAQLSRQRTAFFTVNVVARKPEKNRPDTNPYMVKLMKRLDWRPALLDVFAGKIDYPRYGFFDRQIIRFIMFLTKGPTGANDVVEFTDWARVDAFAEAVLALS